MARLTLIPLRTIRFGLEFPDVYDDESGWEKVEANFIQSVVRGPLFWMGLVDLGWEGPQTGSPSAFRLTPLGLWLLKQGPQPQIPAEGGQVIVQPNLHIIALDPIQEATLINLDHFAERLTAERAVEYQLTRQSVYRGQQTGWEAPTDQRVPDRSDRYRPACERGPHPG